MVPFLHRCEGQREGAAKSLLREYLVSLAQHDLTLPLLVFQHSKPDVSIQPLRRGHAQTTAARTLVACLPACLHRVKAGAASLSRRCYIYHPTRTETRTGRLVYSQTHTTHIHTKREENCSTATQMYWECQPCFDACTFEHADISLPLCCSASRRSSGTQTSWWGSPWTASTAVRGMTSSASVMISWNVCRRGAMGEIPPTNTDHSGHNVCFSSHYWGSTINDFFFYIAEIDYHLFSHMNVSVPPLPHVLSFYSPTSLSKDLSISLTTTSASVSFLLPPFFPPPPPHLTFYLLHLTLRTLRTLCIYRAHPTLYFSPLPFLSPVCKCIFISYGAHVL